MIPSIYSQQFLIFFSLAVVSTLIIGGILIIIFKKENKYSDVHREIHPAVFKFKINIGFLIIFLGFILHLYTLKTFNNDKFIDIKRRVNTIDTNISALANTVKELNIKNKQLILKLNQRDKNGTNSN